MATLYIAEYPALAAGVANEGAVPLLALPPTVQYALTVAVTTSYSPVPIQPTTAWVELETDTTCSIMLVPYAIASTYTFTTQVGRLNANERIIRRVPCSPQYGGASQDPQLATTYGIVTSISS